ncbi:TPA: fimbria/pilus periplasmic chaperone [Providencia rettgeri]|uniref:fimbria/pilus periplasmic chaperone n=1 Tax=Providencia rettgeri TaxID=587 RepID=UPI00068A303A|nr:fimbria/pilus periplasmic chaperone [Providencia rettgeri]EJD6672739.1 fimbria/pilus periplasmic chaperone [Providencia rettgeri]HEM7509592.1 fimbria/pilus periplasmic chaperone [Providencia rettgeri]HEM8269622.1 fimbria/pilus periplasmic chaperone [Providencia rettgeri]
MFNCRRVYFSTLVLITSFLYSSFSMAGGVALGATRVIYPMGAKQVSLTTNNTDQKNRFLVQTWIDNENDQKTKEFIVTPPLFVSKPKSENTLRISFNGGEYPQDRETLFWLNSKAIPAVDKNTIENENVLQIAVLSRIKIFLRPENLPISSDDAPKTLTFTRSQGKLVVHNPSPYYLTLVNVFFGKEKLESFMIAPKSDFTISVTGNNGNTVTYQTINDYGATLSEVKVAVK